MRQLSLTGDDARMDGEHRYTLSRSWGDGARAVWCMLNPSTADETANDPTIRRCIGFAQRWGLDGIEVVNLFSWRATDPRDVVANLADAATAETDKWIRSVCTDAPFVVAAWGRYAGRRWVKERAESVLSMLHFHGVVVDCLGRNADGSPKHPLMVPYATPRECFGQEVQT